MVRLVFLAADGARTEVNAEVGDRVLDVAQSAGVPMEGACEGSMACSTCHVILSDADFARFAEPSVEEDDLLDIAYGAKPTSRLACQLTLDETHDGLVLALPAQTRSLLF